MPTITDDRMVGVLRPFVAATGPVLTGLRDADPFRLGRLARRRALELESGTPERAGSSSTSSTSSASSSKEPASRLGKVRRLAGRGRSIALDRLATSRLPGTPRWDVMTPDERDAWWVGRVGRFTSAVASVPGIGGVLARRLPVSDILGLAAQGLVLCAIAGEHGVDDRDAQVRMLGSVLFGRDLTPEHHGDPHDPEVERAAGELTGELDTRGTTKGARDGRLRALARSLWRMGHTLFALSEELDRRPQGRRVWRLLANIPVVGALASYRNERSALRRAARRAVAWVASERGGGSPRRRGRS